MSAVATRERHIRLPEVLDRSGLSKSEVYRRIRAGTFPASYKEGHRTVYWVESDFSAWQQRRVSAGISDLLS